MKTLKKLKQESVIFYTENAAIYFAQGFSKKMGGVETITFENNFLSSIEIDKRIYYQGRGTKYNTLSIHEYVDTFVTKSEFDAKVDSRVKCIFERQKELVKEKKELNIYCQNKKINVENYSSFNGDTVVYFEKKNKQSVEADLEVSLDDFFNSTGKTYLFQESRIGLLRFYHNHNQSYSFETVSESKKLEFESNRESWVTAPYAAILGQNGNINLYVC